MEDFSVSYLPGGTGKRNRTNEHLLTEIKFLVCELHIV